ncbi:tRNA dimethylallyltransferase [Bacteroidales bacterium Barb6XT]|nr:tRNA dimethylallyltransferase [Bacteroidales bacterium Barb6XT]
MKTLVVLPGATGVGKTEVSLRLAERFGCPVISADSRQIYRELPIGTAAPSAEDLARIRHYLVGTHSLTDYYSASLFEEDVLRIMEELQGEIAVMAGGSMMYMDAVCRGIDDIPTVSEAVRTALYAQFEREGLEGILAELKDADPIHYGEVDQANYKRVIHAVEVCRMAGRPYSSFRTRTVKSREFRIVKVGLRRERGELCERINARVDQMMDAGLLEEARRVYPYKGLNALNTVGYKELFRYLDGEWTLEAAIEKMKRNTRVYARKQMTWFKRDEEITWFHPDQEEEIMAFVADRL